MQPEERVCGKCLGGGVMRNTAGPGEAGYGAFIGVFIRYFVPRFVPGLVPRLMHFFGPAAEFLYTNF